MSHIRSKEDLLKLRKYIEDLDQEDLPIKTINDVLNEIIPKNELGKNMVGKVVTDSSLSPAAYIPKANTINISRKSFMETTNKTVEILEEETGLKKIKNKSIGSTGVITSFVKKIFTPPSITLKNAYIIRILKN